MRRLIGLSILAFAVTVGIVVANRLSSEAMAVVVGIVCGVLASVPTSLLLLIFVRRMRSDSSQQSAPPQHQYPPVIVINPNSAPSGRSQDLWSEPGGSQPAGYVPRDFRIVGEEDEEDW